MYGRREKVDQAGKQVRMPGLTVAKIRHGFESVGTAASALTGCSPESSPPALGPDRVISWHATNDRSWRIPLKKLGGSAIRIPSVAFLMG